MPKTSNSSYNYSEHNPTVSDRYYTDTWKVRQAHQPVEHESLKTYVSRLGLVVRTAEEDAHTHIKWHTHQSAGECWICVQLQALNVIYDIMAQIDPKGYTFVLRDGMLRLLKGSKSG